MYLIVVTKINLGKLEGFLTDPDVGVTQVT